MGPCFPQAISIPKPLKDKGKVTAHGAKSSTLDSIFASFLQACPDAMAVCTDRGLIRSLNPAAQRLFGYDDEEIAEQKFASLLMPVPPHEMAVSQDYWDAAARLGNLKARKKSGEIFPVVLSKTEIEVNGGKLFIISMRDNSCKQRLHQRIADLQRELFHLSRYTVLGELASAITHELNQPLAAIKAYAFAARQNGAAAGESQSKENGQLLDKVAAQASRCGQIIHKLKRLVGDRNIDRVYDDLCSTVQEAVQLASMDAVKHNIEVTVSLPPQPVVMLMDRLQIQLLVTNLVRNAIDELASWRHERKIEIALTLPSAVTAELSVADSGPGIKLSEFESIFDSFYTTKPEGLGMGLALTRLIAEAHSGRLAAANRPAGGAVFKFLIPINPSEKVTE